MFFWNSVFIVYLCFFIGIELFDILSKVQGMRNRLHQKALNYIKNKPNYKLPNIGVSGGNLANFASLGVVTWRGIHFSGFFCGFLYASPDSTNQQKMKKIWEGDVRRCAIWHGMAHIYFLMPLFCLSSFSFFFYLLILRQSRKIDLQDLHQRHKK